MQSTEVRAEDGLITREADKEAEDRREPYDDDLNVMGIPGQGILGFFLCEPVELLISDIDRPPQNGGR